MFTGIIEALGKIEKLETEKGNLHLFCSCPFTHELKVDQSLSHNGVCLTIIEIRGNIYKVTAIKETLDKTNISQLKNGDLLNLERCMPATGRFDGHIVQGHVDQTAVCIEKKEENGSWIFTFEYYPSEENITVEKGSITVNGVSLTVVNSQANRFSVCIIPYTFEHTNFKTLQIDQKVNLEFDIVGKYITRLMQLKNK
ncbi:MAG TPA: riboflavin synthase [Bacteroidia bacterium]|jgi:riboflavin synthase|nr:riboflavin synthase [Bacteroidia bacterium]